MNIDWKKVADSLEGKSKALRLLTDMANNPASPAFLEANIARAVFSGLADSIRQGLPRDPPSGRNPSHYEMD